MAAALSKMSWGSQKELTRLIWWKITAENLSKSTKKWLEKVLKEAWISAISTPKELTTEEMWALAKNYSLSDLPKTITSAITTSIPDEEE
jgi:PIN domain nuclease of toxin-antitoxin system